MKYTSNEDLAEFTHGWCFSFAIRNYIQDLHFINNMKTRASIPTTPKNTEAAII